MGWRLAENRGLVNLIYLFTGVDTVSAEPYLPFRLNGQGGPEKMTDTKPLRIFAAKVDVLTFDPKEQEFMRALDKREEVRRARLLSETLDRIARPTPAQRWLESVGPKLEQFRKEDRAEELFDMGYRAWNEGGTCPFNYDTEEAEQWRSGWNHARADNGRDGVGA